MEKVMEKSWNVMEFGFENCVGTLEKCANKNIAYFFIPWSLRLNFNAIYAENTTKSWRKLRY